MVDYGRQVDTGKVVAQFHFTKITLLQQFKNIFYLKCNTAYAES